MSEKPQKIPSMTRAKRQAFSWRLWVMICGLLFSCAGKKTSRETMDEANESSRASPSSYASDNFYSSNRSPADRPVRYWDFFYKHCKLIGRDSPVPSQADWDCTNPGP